MKFLLVDDSRTMRNIWKKVVSSIAGTEVFEAGDGLEGLKQITENGPFDVMLVDWNMPNMDGLTMVTKVRETDKKSIIIMCTTEAEKPRIIEAIKAGVNNYVVKPFTPDTLLTKIDDTLKKAGVGQPA
ncbi:MAG: response regulator [Sedimentisphaerales bacterium]|nr:response regulator [Sedimentisphaerales bacterium]MBN2843405.1 response regulator [Sedimentisphaerales bacterium]